jgi:hypothetical protein
MVKVFGGLAKSSGETQRLLATGMPARARVLGMQMGGMTMTVGVHRHLQLIMGLEVHLPGQPPYQAQVTSMMSELQIPQIQPGAWMHVRVDPADRNKIAIEATGVNPQQPLPAAPGQMAQGGPQPYGAPGAGPQPYPAPAQQMQGYGAGGQAFGAPGPQAYPGQAPQPYAAAGGYAPGAGQGPQAYAAAPPAPYGTAPVVGTPVRPLTLPMGAKIGIAVGLLGALVALVVVGAVVVLPAITGGALFSDEDCEKAAKCCKVAASTPDAQKACDNYKRGFGPFGGSACKDSAREMKKMAEAFGKKCD